MMPRFLAVIALPKSVLHDVVDTVANENENLLTDVEVAKRIRLRDLVKAIESGDHDDVLVHLFLED